MEISIKTKCSNVRRATAMAVLAFALIVISVQRAPAKDDQAAPTDFEALRSVDAKTRGDAVDAIRKERKGRSEC